MCKQLTENGEWFIEKDGIGEYGLTAESLKLIGDIVYLEVEHGFYDKDEVIGIVESTKAASDLYAPYAIEILSTNDDVIESLELDENTVLMTYKKL